MMIDVIDSENNQQKNAYSFVETLYGDNMIAKRRS